ncbi:MAG: alpha-amylase family glycosyl hydrolase, partial [Myxococcota bacterium]
EHRWFPAQGGGWYYGFFGAELPDLDWTHARTRERMFQVFDRWLDHVDGYRLDAVITLVEADGAITGTDDTHALLAELLERARKVNPDAVVLAEASEASVSGTAAYLGAPAAPEADRVLDFPRRAALLAALAEGRPDGLLGHLHDQEDAAALGRTSPFLQSHDLSRLPAHVPDARARRLLEVLQLTLPGDPVLYYGEELDLADATTATGQDYAWRAPMPWDGSANGGFTTAAVPWFTLDPGYTQGRNVADAEADPTSLLTLMRGLACVRAELEGADWSPVATDAESVLAYTRATAEGRVIVVANLGGESVGDVAVDVHGGFRDLTRDEGVYAADGLRVPGLEPYGYRLYGDEVATRCAVAPPLTDGG